MNYKKMISNRSLRIKLLGLLSFIPDKLMIIIQYRIKTGRRPNLKNPKRYTEKLQWYKLNYHDPKMTICADKYTVREYVEKKGLGKYLNELYCVYDKVEDIDFNKLPNSFIIKETTGSGTNILVENKMELNQEKAKKKISSWMNRSKKNPGREWSYYNSKRRIIVEKLLERDNNNDIPDYKFFCFDGEVYCLYTMVDYIDNHENGKLGFFDKHFNLLPFRRTDFGRLDREIEMPLNFEKMIEIAEILAKGFPHVRIDLYNIDGNITFGEMTFYNGSGYTNFLPDEFDSILGSKFKLPIKV